MSTEKREKINDLVKEIVWNCIIFILALLYWMFMLLIISFVLNSVIRIGFEQIMISSVVLSALTTLIRIIKKRN